MFCVALALVHVDCQHVHYTATVIMVRALLLESLAAFDGLCTGHFSSREGYEKASSWYSKGWAPSQNTSSGWKRATRGYYSHEWDEDASRGSTQTREVQREAWADAGDKNQERTPTNDAVSSKTANAAGNSAGDAATEKDATMRRLGKLHLLLSNREGSFSAMYKKNADANDKAYDLNQKSIQALDALAKEYVDFEATMANVTSEHGAGDVLHAATLEVAEELERTQKDQGRLQDDLDCSCDALAAATKKFRLLGGTRGHGRSTLQRLQGRLQPTCSS